MAPLYALCLAVPLVGGCTPPGIGLGTDTEAVPKIEERRPDPAELRLAETAARAEAALTALARIASAQIPQPTAGIAGDVPAALRRPVTLDWIGPVESVAASLAQYAGYRFAAAGARPVRPVMVEVGAADTPLIEILRDIGIQAGAAATLLVDADGRSVRLDWTAEHSGSGERPGSGNRTGTAPGQEGT